MNYRLRLPASAEDARFLYEIRSDQEVLKNLVNSITPAYEDHLEYLSRVSDSITTHVYIFEGDNTRMGVGRFNDINRIHGIAEVGGDMHKDFRGKGHGRGLYTAIINTARAMELRKLYLHVFAYNHRAIELYSKIGFQIIGIHQKHYLKNGIPQNIIIMEMFI